MEFNSLSVVYGRPSEKFLKDNALKQSVAAEKKYYPKERGFQTSDQQEKLLETQVEKPAEVDNLLDMGGKNTEPASNQMDLLDTGIDLLGGGGDTNPPADNFQQNVGDLLGGDNSNDLLGGFGGGQPS